MQIRKVVTQSATTSGRQYQSTWKTITNSVFTKNKEKNYNQISTDAAKIKELSERVTTLINFNMFTYIYG